MFSSILAGLAVSLSLAISADSTEKPQRKPHPFAPSLPKLTAEEEKAMEEIVDRFILFDTGKLTGEEGKKAKEEFDKLGPDATFVLIRGLNKAAAIDHSCPALVIGTKLQKILSTTADKDLLEFARDNIGAGVTDSKHGALLKNLQNMCTFRKNALVRAGVGSASLAPTGEKSLSKLTATELAVLTTSKPTQAKAAIEELTGRTGDDALNALALVISTAGDGELKKSAQSGLDKNMAKLSQAALKEKLKDANVDIRLSAVRTVGSKGFRLGAELIDLLGDESEMVRETAHQALVRLAGGKTDFGPQPKDDLEKRDEAVKKWREWWSKQR